MTKFQVNLTDIKHDEMSFYDQRTLSKTQEGGLANIDLWREGRPFNIGLPSVSKFFNEDLGGMTKISERDPNMNMKRGVLITDGSMQILTLIASILPG